MRWYRGPDPVIVESEVFVHRSPVWKMALLSWIGLWPMVTLMMWIVRPQLAGLAVPAQTLIMTAMIVPLMTWVLMPALTRLFRGWLLPR